MLENTDVKKRPLRRWVLLAVGVVFLCVLALVLTSGADAARFKSRGMYINSSIAGATTWYQVSLEYTTAANIGSVRLEFCDSPIPSLPCDVPAGLDLSSASLSSQSGETGFSLDHESSNILTLSRSPSMTGAGLSSYRLDDVVNPSAEDQPFYARITSHTSTDGTGPIVDYGSVSATTVKQIELYTQVPPILIFCVGQTVSEDCSNISGHNVDFGELEPGTTTYAATSEMAARTNAYYGFNIYVSGTSFTSGIRVVPALTVPTESFIGVGQFGLNLADNSVPDLGAGPTGPGVNDTINPLYNQPDRYLFNNGELVVSSPTVNRARKFTSTYILNLPDDQPAGIYSTTMTYICTASF